MSGTNAISDGTDIESGSNTKPVVHLVEGNYTCVSTEETQVIKPSGSIWTYLRWILWFIVTGFLRCGRAIFVPFTTSVNHQSLPRLEDDTTNPCSNCDIQESATISIEAEATSELVNECCDYPPPKTVLQSAYISDFTPEPEIPSTEGINPTETPKFFTELGTDPPLTDYSSYLVDDSDPNSIPNGYHSEFPTLLSSAYRLLHQDPGNNCASNLELECSIDDILKSVIPRNLSDCEGVTVSPAIRKMYAWNKNPENCVDQDGMTERCESLAVKSDLCDPEKQLAHPGRLSMCDAGPSPPLSPSTLDSSTTVSEVSHMSNNAADIALPSSDEKEQTLVWAMKSLQMATDLNFPPVGVSRQSRDKSPSATVNSMRLPDIFSTPNFMSTVCYLEPESTPKPKRSSSLKSQRTPPGTPEGKSVRFADALGLELETVRHVFDQEAPPKIPASATFDLELESDEAIAKLGAKQFSLGFAQPGCSTTFVRRVLEQTVCLEDAHVNMPRGVLTGTIRVRSLGFEKRVFVRITYNNWATYCDTPASYVQGSHDGTTDRFAFSVVFPDIMVPGDRAQFAIRYEAHTGQQFWDNNFGQNYSVSCYAKATDLAGDGSWVHYL